MLGYVCVCLCVCVSVCMLIYILWVMKDRSFLDIIMNVYHINVLFTIFAICKYRSLFLGRNCSVGTVVLLLQNIYFLSVFEIKLKGKKKLHIIQQRCQDLHPLRGVHLYFQLSFISEWFGQYKYFHKEYLVYYDVCRMYFHYLYNLKFISIPSQFFRFTYKENIASLLKVKININEMMNDIYG